MQLDNIIQQVSEKSNPEFTETVKKYKMDPRGIIGLPPAIAEHSDDDHYDIISTKVLQSMLIMYIEPSWPSYQAVNGDGGLNIFTLDPTKGAEKYNGILKGANIKPYLEGSSQGELKIAVLNDTAVSESFSNDYSDSNYESAANMGSNAAQELHAVTGKDKLSESVGALSKGVQDTIAQLAPGLSEQVNAMLQKATETVAGGIKSVEDKAGQNGLTKGLMQIASQGSKVDFPMIWRGSTYSPSWSFTVRLINPYPPDYNSYLKYIVTPLAHLLALALPISDSSFTFSFPVLLKVKCPGLFSSESAYISNMDIIKGGDSFDISFYQRPGTVDVRFTISELYSTMIAKNKEDGVTEDRPTLLTYLDALKGITVPPKDTNKGPYLFRNPSTFDIMPLVEELLDDVSSPQFVREVFNRKPISSLLENRLPLYAEDAQYDRINLLNVLGSENSTELLANIITSSNYEMPEDGLSLPESIALKLKNQVPVGRELENWFWSNLNEFPDDVQDIVADVQSSFGDFEYNVNTINSGNPIETGGF